MRIGLVLEGGGMRAMYTAGVLDIFLENNIEVNGVVGVSAGVLFGVNYVSKQKGRCLRYNLKYANDKRYMGMHSLLTTGNIVNKDFAYYELPLKLDIFDDETFQNSATKFYATVTNVETGKPEYIQLHSVINQIEVLRATSAMPLVSEIIDIDGKKYLDGGISDSIPIDKCKSLGYDKIIVVLTRPIEYRKKKGNNFFNKIVYRKYPSLIRTLEDRYKNYNEAVEKIIDMENRKEIFVIRPTQSITVGRIEKDVSKLQDMYNLGVEDCKKSIKELIKYINN